MKASYNKEKDIVIYLAGEEIERLGSETLEGIVVELEHPRNQSMITLAVAGESLIGGWEVERNGEYHVLMWSNYYDQLKELGETGG